MNWIALDQLLEQTPASRPVALCPALEHEALRQQALRLAGGLRSRNITRLALHLEDAGDLAIALLGAWRAGVTVLLPADLQPATRQRLADQADLWLTDQAGDSVLAELLGDALPAAPLDLDQCRLLLCTSGSSGEPKLIEKRLRQLANEVEVLEAQWGAELGQACIIGSVAAQHIYGLLFRVLWPLCAGRPLLRRALPFPEDIQLASRKQAGFCLVASPALLKRMGDNLDWPALSRVRRVFSSGGPLPAEAAHQLQQRLDQAPTEIYGSSETGGIAWRQGGSLWQPFVGVELSQDEQ
ncbi:class I adenylate-forming enzyme family protein, partial [Stutzerimonas nitrititolerans]